MARQRIMPVPEDRDFLGCGEICFHTAGDRLLSAGGASFRLVRMGQEPALMFGKNRVTVSLLTTNRRVVVTVGAALDVALVVLHRYAFFSAALSDPISRITLQCG